MKRRFKPKQWERPRSRRAKTVAAARALGVDPFTIPVADILKDIYHAGLRRPSWARLAYGRGWMTGPEYYALPATERDPKGDITRLLYAESPFFRMLKKDAAA